MPEVPQAPNAAAEAEKPAPPALPVWAEHIRSSFISSAAVQFLVHGVTDLVPLNGDYLSVRQFLYRAFCRGKKVVFYVVGRRGDGALTFRKQTIINSWTGFTDRPAFSNARDIGEDLTAAYIDGDIDRVEVIYNRYVSPLTQHVYIQTLLPVQEAGVIGEGSEDEAGVEPEGELAEAHARASWEYEPEPEELMARLVPDYINTSLYRMLLESAASELGARMTAMRSAADNAEQMIDDLTLEMNRVRQAEITQEILEVVGGAEALG